MGMLSDTILTCASGIGNVECTRLIADHLDTIDGRTVFNSVKYAMIFGHPGIIKLIHSMFDLNNIDMNDSLDTFLLCNNRDLADWRTKNITCYTCILSSLDF